MNWKISYYQTPHDNRAQPFKYQELAQVVKLTPFLSGQAIQILMTNVYGKTPLKFKRLLLADREDFSNAVLVPKNGVAEFVIPQGQSIGMDAITFPVKAGQPLYFRLEADQPQTYVDLASTYDPSLVNASINSRVTGQPHLRDKWHQRKSWFSLAGFRVLRENSAPLVELAGDSLIETGMVAAAIGKHLLTNYPDQVTMINTAISGSQLVCDSPTDTPLFATFGPSLLHRLTQSTWRPQIMIASAGGNDLMMPSISSQKPVPMTELEAGFEQLTRLVKQRRGKLLVPTLGPKRDKDAAYGGGKARVNQAREQLNKWLSQFSWAVDVTNVLSDDQGFLASQYDFGDHLHLSPAGGVAFADALIPQLDQLLREGIL